MLAPNTVLQQRYLILQPIGQGGMGAVYMARDQRLRCTVALKETLFSDERLRRAFEREAHLLASLRHPALPRVSDHFTEESGQFLVLEYIPGDDLEKMIQQRAGPFPVETVLEWADQLLDALDYLHTQEPPVIHRDIKPQNIKLARGQIILLDFGLAKGTTSQMSRVTTTGSVFGYTPNYAPLEQIQDAGTNPRSDIYSLAATLHHLIVGEKPPDALSRAASVLSGQSDPLHPTHELNPEVPRAVSEVLWRALSLNPDRRPATADQMRQSLRAARQNPAGENGAPHSFSAPIPFEGLTDVAPGFGPLASTLSGGEALLAVTEHAPDGPPDSPAGARDSDGARYCPNCGTMYEGEELFCLSDGTRLLSRPRTRFVPAPHAVGREQLPAGDGEGLPVEKERRRAEEERLRLEEAARLRREEEDRLRRETEERRRHAEEELQRRLAEENERRRREAEEAARRRAEEEAALSAEEEKRRVELEEARRQAELQRKQAEEIEQRLRELAAVRDAAAERWLREDEERRRAEESARLAEESARQALEEEYVVASSQPARLRGAGTTRDGGDADEGTESEQQRAAAQSPRPPAQEISLSREPTEEPSPSRLPDSAERPRPLFSFSQTAPSFLSVVGRRLLPLVEEIKSGRLSKRTALLCAGGAAAVVILVSALALFGYRRLGGATPGSVLGGTAAEAHQPFALQRTLAGARQLITSVAVSPDGKTVAGGVCDKTVGLWDVQTGRQTQSLGGHGGCVHAVAFSSDGQFVASGGADKTVRVWDTQGRRSQTLFGTTDIVWSVAFSPDGKTLASGSGSKDSPSEVQLWDVGSGRLVQKLKGHTSLIYSIAFSPDGKRVASGSWDRTVRIWDAQTGAPLSTLEEHRNLVYAVAFSPDGATLAAAGGEKGKPGEIWLWDVRTGELRLTLKGHDSPVYTVAFLRDGKTLVSGGDDHTLRLWDARTGSLLQTLTGHGDDVSSVAPSPGAELVVSGSADKTLKVWEARAESRGR